MYPGEVSTQALQTLITHQEEGMKTMPDLPLEVITEILSRLPVKSLLRFRCVHKSWCALIDSQRFIKLHLKQSNSDQTLLLSGMILYSADFDSIFQTNTAKIAQIDPPVKCLPVGMNVEGCCNGLVCLWGTSSKYQQVIMLWNPSTRQYRELPDFGECGITTYFGFGYDAVNDDYKVVNIMQFENPLHATLNVYSSRSNKLGNIRPFPYCCMINGARGVFAAGVLHWIVSTGLHDPPKWIAAFDLTTESTHLVPQPDCSLKKDYRMNLADLGGSLSLIYYYKRKYAADIWIMKEYGKKESWTKIASIVNSDSMSFFFLCPISYSRSGKQILLAKNDEDLVCYDLEEKSAKNFELLRQPLGLYFQFGVYSGSLVRLNSDAPIKADDRGQGLSKHKNNAKRDKFLSSGFKLVL